MTVVQGMPDLKVDVACIVDNLDEGDVELICEGDIISIKVKLTRKNMSDEEGDQASLVYSQAIEFEKKEVWWVICANKNGNDKPLIDMKKVTGQGKEEEAVIQFMAPPPGKYEFEILVKSDSYIGLDQSHILPFQVHGKDKLPEFIPHPDDVDLDNEPTLWDTFNDGAEDSDSDWDEDGTGEEGARRIKAPAGEDDGLTDAQRAKQARRRQEKLDKQLAEKEAADAAAEAAAEKEDAAGGEDGEDFVHVD